MEKETQFELPNQPTTTVEFLLEFVDQVAGTIVERIFQSESEGRSALEERKSQEPEVGWQLVKRTTTIDFDIIVNP